MDHSDGALQGPARMGRGSTAVPGRGETARRRPWQATAEPSAPFARILCAIDASRGSNEAVRRAIALSSPGASLTFLAIAHSLGEGLAAQAELGEGRARAALEEAVQIAAQAGVKARAELRHGAPASDILLEEAGAHDLLAVGCHGGSRLGGIMLGSTASQVAHRCERPLLVARRSVDGSKFPRTVLLATDGSPGSWVAARAATRLARAAGSQLRLVYVPDGTHPERYREVLKQLTVIEKATGASPAVVDNPGHVAERIGEAARANQASLIVIGRRGLHGVKALGSVSEQVVHKAPCSVLVVPPAQTG
jgi:nucleotide-binding universal stress UspA family protein